MTLCDKRGFRAENTVKAAEDMLLGMRGVRNVPV